MSMRALMNVQRAQAAMAAQVKQPSRLGIISAYDPNTYTVKVQYPPDTVETGWIPLGALATGANWGIYAGPVVGDQIEVHFQDGGADAGIAGLRMFDNQSPPTPVPSGEIWLLHKLGAFFKLTNDGRATFSDGAGASVALNGNGTITSTGNWTHNANFTVTGMTSVAAITSNGHDISSTHKHTGVSTGSGITGAPQ